MPTSKLPIHIERRLQILRGIIKEGDEILDVGCGAGTYITDTLGELPVKITAIDYDEKSIQYAKEHNKHNNVEYVVASGEFYCPMRFFDVVICSHVLEHSKDPARLLIHLRTLLKENGKLFLAIPNGYGDFECENLIPRALSKFSLGRKIISKLQDKSVKDSLNHETPHVQHFTMGWMRCLLEHTGWELNKVFNEQLIGGVISDRTILKIPMFAKLNMTIGNKIPKWSANGWILISQPKWSNQSNTNL